MRRRDWMKTVASAPLAGIATEAAQAAGGGNTIEAEIFRLKLQHTWTTTMSSSTFRDEVQLRFTYGGITGHGEGAPIVRYKEDAAGAKQAIESVMPLLKSADPMQFTKIMAEVSKKVEGQHAAKAAIDIALMDWMGQKLGIPLYRYFGLDPKDAPVTTFSIGIDTPEVTKQKVKEAEQYPVLKVKVGLDKDESTMESIRSVTNKPLRLDANEGFKSKEEAVRKINWLATLGVEFIEQPLPADQLEEARWVHSRAKMPIFADEACVRASDIPKLASAYDGIVVKLDKSGGMQEVLKMIDVARSFGLKVMIGCMISSSVSITAAAHLSPLCDYADLDGNLLIANDPYRGVKVVNGKLVLPNGPGLGLVKA
jgi:L-alanine-DL-glutamate epimerase-like enolase superfamily enzyme